MDSSIYTFAAAAVLFLSALLVGRAVFQWHLPRVTGYLLVGLCAGPSLSHLVGYPTLLDYADLDRRARITHRSNAHHARHRHAFSGRAPTSLAASHCRSFTPEIGITFTAVAIATAITHFFFGDVEQIEPLHVGLFLGIISIATAPAATLLVIREYDSAGPVTDVVRTLIGLNNLVCTAFQRGRFLAAPTERFA